MQNRSLFFVLAICMSFVASSVLAQSSPVLTNVQTYLNYELGRTPEVRKQRIIEVEETHCHEFGGGGSDWCSVGTILSIAPSSEAVPMCGPRVICTKVKVGKVDIYTAPPRIANWQILEISELVLKEERMVRLPDNLYVKTVQGKNCSKASDLPIGQTLSFVSTESVSHTVSRGVSTSTSVTARVSFKPPKGFGGSLGAGFTRGVSLTNTDTQSTSRSISQSFDFRVKVAPRRLLTARAIVAETSLIIPFSGTILVDGNIDNNLDGIKKVSQRLSPSARTMPVEGELRVTASTDVNSEQNDRILTDEECVNGDNDSSVIFGEFTTKDATNSLALSGIRAQTISTLEAGQRRNTKKTDSLLHVVGNSGGLCYIGPCTAPPDGYREYCYFDVDGICTDCGEEFDPVCEPFEFLK